MQFKEVQKFRQPWLWILILLPGLVTAGILAYQLATGDIVGDKPLSNTALILVFLLTEVPLVAFFYFTKLITVVDAEGIHFKLTMIHLKFSHVKWEEIESLQLVKYNFIIGYGYRITRKYGVVYNIRGNDGLLVKKKNGDKLMIGTQRADELRNTLAEMSKLN